MTCVDFFLRKNFHSDSSPDDPKMEEREREREN